MVAIAIVIIKMVYPELNLAASGRVLRARLPIDDHLTARDGANRQGGLDGWRGMGKYLVFTYHSGPSIAWWDFQAHFQGKLATSCFDCPATRI